jgi:hypothetical protein
MLLRGLRAASRKATALYDDALGKAAGNPNIKVGKTPWTLVATGPVVQWRARAAVRYNSRPSRLRVTPLRCVKALLPLLFYVRRKCDEFDVVESS